MQAHGQFVEGILADSREYNRMRSVQQMDYQAAPLITDKL